MKKILLFLMLCVSMGAKAQRVDKPGEAYDYYCIVYYDAPKAGITIVGYRHRNWLVDNNGKELEFLDIAEVLTHMSKRGWEYVEETVYRDTPAFIMKKSVTNDKEAKEMLLTDTDYAKMKKE